MQDKAIAAIGEWQLEENKHLEPVDLYIENMFPGKDYQMLLIVFGIINDNGELTCEYKGIDIEKVSAEKDSYRIYAFRNGTSARAGDVTISTRLTVKKLNNIKELQFRKILNQKNFDSEVEIFKIIEECFIANYLTIENQIKTYLSQLPKGLSSGISLKIINKKELYLRDFEVVKNIIIQEFFRSKIENNGTVSKCVEKKCSVSGLNKAEIYGFAAPFPYSSPDKEGFISGFFNKKMNWRNYPVSEDEALKLELGGRYISNNLTGYFYGHEYLVVPNPIIKTDNKKLKRIIELLKTAFQVEKIVSPETKRRAEEHVIKLIGKEGENYFNVDIAFYKTVQSSMKINLMLEEILPSRFRKLFIDAPEKVNKNPLFKNAIKNNNELQDLVFSYQIVKGFFEKNFLDVVQKLFLGKSISQEYIFENVIGIIRKNHNASKTSNGWVEPMNRTILKAIMLLSYLQELKVINYNQNYKYMEIESIQKKESSFNLEGFNEFVKTNSNFLDSDIKIGIFAVGVMVRLLYAIQSQSLNTSNPPFENKLKGYKLNSEILMKVYTEALDKIQKYQKNNYVYTELREIISNYFILKTHELKKMTNNELSFYFVAGLEMGKQFKRDKQENQ
jgi:CRISPR-associated protein Csh1